MKKTVALMILISLTFALAGCGSSEEAAINRAISKVYPALVFIKPITTDLRHGEKVSFQVYGSGSIISEDGYVVTNNHVAEKAKEITCVLFNKEEISAEVVGLDPESDIAVLKLDKDALAEMMKKKGMQRLPFANWADSNVLKEGAPVLALGAPFGYTRSVTKGIVSSTERYFEDVPHHLWIQTDASINPGNSGGPLVDMKGDIVGINTLGIEGGGMGFSIPSNVAKDIVERIIADKKVIRSYIGLSFQAIHDFTRSTHMKAEEGVIIANVDRDSPSQRAGIQSGDILLSCNGNPITALYQTQIPAIVRFFASWKIGVEITLTVKRGEEVKELTLVTEEKGKFEGDELECPVWNCGFKEITKDTNPFFHFIRSKGVYILGIKYDGNARSSGLYRGDIIVKIGDKEIMSIKDLKEVYEELIKLPKGKRKVPVIVNRYGLEKLLILDFETNVKQTEEEYE